MEVSKKTLFAETSQLIFVSKYENYGHPDFVGGYQDLNNKRLKSIEIVQTFREDPVRILRAIRFKAKLGLELDPELEKNIVSLSYLLDEIPSGRNYEETIKMFLTGNSIEIFDEMQKFNLTKYLIPITNDFLKSKKDRRFIKTALRNTDARYKANKTSHHLFFFQFYFGQLSLEELMQ